MASIVAKVPTVPALIAPTEDAWRAMSPAAREALLVRVLDVLSDPAVAMSEGRRHKKAKTRALDALGLHFGAVGRTVYLAEEMAVLYPGQPVFSPDLLAVIGVAEPEDDARMAWVVADEGKGLDLVIEVLHHGDRNKDLVDNVERYAGLGIPEYFVYDRLRQRIHGYRLEVGAKRYARIVPQFGRYTSAVLGLDLAIEAGRLRFFYGMAELPGTSDLIGRLNGMVADFEARADEAEAQLETTEAQLEAQAAQLEIAEAQLEVQAAQIREAQAENEKVRAANARAQAESERALAALRDAIAALLGARGVACSDADRERLVACADAGTLQRWLVRAMSAGSADEVLSG